jgi:hypothetical protein
MKLPKLPNLLIRVMPDSRCVACGQHGYVLDKAQLCLACMNMSLLQYAKLTKERGKP